MFDAVTPTSTLTSNSCDGMLSPDILQSNANNSRLGECDVFYLLKKDYQRRVTLSKIIMTDDKVIRELWMNAAKSDVDDCCVHQVRSEFYLLLYVVSFKLQSDTNTQE